MTFIGQSMRRVEDERFLTGRGLFVADVNMPGQLMRMSCVLRTRTRRSLGSIPAA